MSFSALSFLLVACISFSLRVLPSKKPLIIWKALVNDKVEVESYFNNEGFNRWNKIYSQSEEVNFVQLDIRNGHSETVNKVLQLFEGEDNVERTVCDAGCGVGSLSIPMASRFRKGCLLRHVVVNNLFKSLF
jgi:hypothetical protein